MPFIHDGMRGIADFVIKVSDPETGAVRYEPVDAKLVVPDAKPGHVLQLCSIRDAIEALTGIDPGEHACRGWGSNRTSHCESKAFRPYWRRLRHSLAAALAAGPHGDTNQSHARCEYCEFNTTCEEQWRREDSLVYVAGIRRSEIEAFKAGAVATLTQLADLNHPADEIDGIRSERLKRLSSKQSCNG